jgi:hypothetical protein
MFFADEWDKGETVRFLCGVGSAVGENFSASTTVESLPSSVLA